MEETIVINETVEDMLKSIIDVQRRQEQMIKDLTNTVDTIQHSLMTDKKHTLEKEIQECLNQGYASFKQNKKITSDYLEYGALRGNGEIKELYEKHYLNLKVHE